MTALPRSRPALVVVGWLLALLATARDALATRAGFLPLGAATPANPGTMKDFRDAAYFPVRELLRSGGMPYDPQSMFAHWPVAQEFDLYLPFHLLLHAPFVLLPYPVAASVQFLLNVTLLVLLCAWTLRWAVDAGLPRNWAAPGLPLLVTALVTSQVGKAQLETGQVNPLVAVGAAGALGLRDSPRLAALCLALAWTKPQYGLPLTAILLVRGAAYRRTAVVGTVAAAGEALPVALVLVARAGGVGALLDIVRTNLDYAAHNPETAAGYPLGERIDLLAVLARVLGWAPGGLAQALAPVVVVGLTAAGVRLLSARPAGTPLTRAGADLLCLAGTLTALVHQPGDSLAALPALVLAAVAALTTRTRPASGTPRAHRLLLLVAAALVAVPFADLHAVTTVLTSLAGLRTARTLDGAAVCLAWLLLLALAALAVRPVRDRREGPVTPQRTGVP